MVATVICVGQHCGADESRPLLEAKEVNRWTQAQPLDVVDVEEVVEVVAAADAVTA